MALTGAYEEGGLVVLEDDEQPPVSLTWRQAMERCRAVMEMEAKEPLRNRQPRIQKLVEQMVQAAVAARKKADPQWSPPASVLGLAVGKKPSRIVVPA